jgi:hypothetical protein
LEFTDFLEILTKFLQRTPQKPWFVQDKGLFYGISQFQITTNLTNGHESKFNHEGDKGAPGGANFRGI